MDSGWSAAGGQVDDRQPPVAELDRDPVVLVAPDASRVRAAVRDPLAHDVHELVTVGLLVAARDSAHISPRLQRDGGCLTMIGARRVMPIRARS